MGLQRIEYNGILLQVGAANGSTTWGRPNSLLWDLETARLGQGGLLVKGFLFRSGASLLDVASYGMIGQNQCLVFEINLILVEFVKSSSKICPRVDNE